MMGLKKLTQALAGIVLLIGLVVLLIELFSSAKGPQAASSTIDPHATPTPTPVNPYAPSNYGIPDTLAGYKVLAVLTADTEACMQPGKKHLILQTSQTNVEDFLKAVDSKAIDTALRQAGLTTDEVEIMIAGPGTTLDVMLSGLQKWNQLMKNGCVRGGPVPPITSRAVDVSATSTPAPASTAEPTAASTLARTLEPTVRGYGGYPVTDTTPGGITILSKGEVIVVPNPVSSLPSEWKIYKDPFYTYTVAYPPEWFLIAPPPDAIEKAYAAGAKQVLGLSISISSVDSSKGPGTEPRVLNPQDSLGIDITVDDYPIKPGESLKEWMTRPIERVWPGAITSIEEVDFKGLPALIVHHRSIAPVDENLALLNIYIAAKDGRVFRIGARPDPKDTIYSDTFKQILDSFTILEQ